MDKRTKVTQQDLVEKINDFVGYLSERSFPVSANDLIISFAVSLIGHAYNAEVEQINE